MATGSNAPIIIKRKKVIAGGGHHGGAWKVAMNVGPYVKRFALGEVHKLHMCRLYRHSDVGPGAYH